MRSIYRSDECITYNDNISMDADINILGEDDVMDGRYHHDTIFIIIVIITATWRGREVLFNDNYKSTMDYLPLS